MASAAVRCLRKAAERAAETAANAEALDNYAKALEHLAYLPESKERAREEIAIRLGLGGVQVQGIDRAADEVERNYDRALELCNQCGRPQERFAALWGKWYVRYMRGDEHGAQAFADALPPIAQSLGDPSLILEAHHVQWGGLTLTGDFRGALAHSTEGIDRYEYDKHHRLTFVYGGHDPGLCAHGINAITLCVLGYLEQAQRRCEAALSLARQVAHPYSALDTLFDAMIVDLIIRDLANAEHHVAALDELLGEGKLPPDASGLAGGMRGWVLAEHGSLERGLDVMRAAQPGWQGLFGVWCFPLDASFAALLGRAGHAEEAFHVVGQALQSAARGGAHWWDGEFHRVRAGLHAPGSDRDRAIADLDKAVADARGRDARSLELRAASDLARIWLDAGERARAHDILAPVYSWFTEGLGARDLVEAKSLLDRL